MLFISLAAQICTVSCNVKPQSKPNNTTENIKPATLYLDSGESLPFYYQDMFGGHPLSVSSDDKTEIFLNAPTFLVLAYDFQNPFLIYPGETIHIREDSVRSCQLYIKDNPQRNNELRFFNILIKKTNNLSYVFKQPAFVQKRSSVTGINDLAHQIFTVQQNRLALLADYAKQFPVSDSFVLIAKNSIECVALFDSLRLYWFNRDFLKKNNMLKKLMSPKLASINNIPFMCYAYNIAASGAIASQALSWNPFADPVKTTDDFIKKYDFIENNFIGERKDFLLFSLFDGAYNSAISVPDKYLKAFNATCKEDKYKIALADKLKEGQEIKYLKNDDNLRRAGENDVEGMQSVLKKYRGKLVVLDFWASWCLPCREEIPYSKELMKTFEQKDVAFVYISLDDNSDNWLSANKKENLPDSNSYILLNSHNTPFTRKYNMSTIPRFMLLGKDGRIINADAPRPSDTGLKKLIESNL